MPNCPDAKVLPVVRKGQLVGTEAVGTGTSRARARTLAAAVFAFAACARIVL